MTNHSNPLLRNESLPLYGEILPEHVSPAVDFLEKEHRKFMDAINNGDENEPVSWHSVMVPLMALEALSKKLFSPVSHLNMVNNSDSLREVYENALPRIISMGLEIGQNKIIYDAMNSILATEKNLSQAQKRTLEGSILSAKLSGIALEEKEKLEFNELQRELMQLSNKFSNNKLDAVKAFKHVVKNREELAGLPASYLEMTSALFQKYFPDQTSTPELGPWCVTLNGPVLLPILEDCSNRPLRELLFRAQRSLASEGQYDNGPVFLEILRLKQKEASLLGFKNYAELSLAKKMAPGVDAIYKLQDDISTASRKKGFEDVEKMKQLAKANQQELHEIEPWDSSYWAKRRQESELNLDEETIKPYFPLDSVLSGLFKVIKILFKVNVVRSPKQVSIWNPDVKFFDIVNESGDIIAGFFLDAYSRPENKQSGAWMDEVSVRSNLVGEKTLSIAQIVCNFTPPTAKQPSLLTLSEIRTMFHEMGHALQHMLTNVDVPPVAGINGVEWDAVELPSQFMELWIFQDFVLDLIGNHYVTGEKLPEINKRQIQNSSKFAKSHAILRQLAFGRVDLELHSNPPPKSSEDAHSLFRRISDQFMPIKTTATDKMLSTFGHIFAGGYAAGYYSYIWADVLSNDAFSAFEDNGKLNLNKLSETGNRFKETVLGLGGSVHPMDVFEAFRGRKPKIDAFLRYNGIDTPT